MRELEFLTEMLRHQQVMEELEVICQELKMNITAEPETVVLQLKGYLVMQIQVEVRM